MNKYEVVFTKTAEKELSKLSSSVVNTIVPVIISLENNPRPLGCKKLKGFVNLWRIRIGKYRIIYSIEDTILLVEIKAVGHRKDIYN